MNEAEVKLPQIAEVKLPQIAEVKLPQIAEILRTMKPNAKQREFFLAREKYVLYGGARGGGKSWSLRMKLIGLCLGYPNLNCVLLRRTLPELETNHFIPMMRMLDGYAKILISKKRFEFPNGSTLKLGYCMTDKDVMQYQGQEFEIVAVDEATQFKGEWVEDLKASLRTVRTDISPQMFFTANPGGIGHAYFKRLFVEREFTELEDPGEYRFVAATVHDNDVLMKNDPDYVRTLERLPETRRKAWLEGSWDVFEGQAFAEFRDNPSGYVTGERSHVINGFMPPPEWRLYQGYDYGYSKPYSFGWYGADPDGTLYCIAELYGGTGKPNEGKQQSPEEQFREAAAFERSHPYLRGRRFIRIADPSIFDKQRGESIADTALKHGLTFYPANNKRLQGFAQVQNRLRFDKNGRAGLYMFRECKNLIRTLPSLLFDGHNCEDVDTECEDHCLTGDTMVHTTEGLRPIRELVGESGEAIGHDNQPHAFRWATKTRSNAEVFSVELENGERITATSEHRFLLTNGSWKRLRELEPGDELATRYDNVQDIERD